MIRNVVLGRLRDAETADEAARDRDQLAQGLAGIAGLTPPGLVDMRVGLDQGLREGGWTFAITNDWVDEVSYRAYDVEAEHNRYRKMIGDVCEQIARVQFTF